MTRGKKVNPYSSKDKKTQEDMRRLVIERIKTASADLGVSIGATEYTQDELVKSVETGNELGQKIIAIQMEYLRDMAEGAIYKDEQYHPHYKTKS